MNKRVVSNKKLYKNVAYLIVSALILISATIAWFSSNAPVSVESIGASAGNTAAYTINYYTTDYYTMAALDGDSSSASLADKQHANAGWTSTGSGLNISSLIPGQYYSFKIVASVGASANVKVVFSDITCEPSVIEVGEPPDVTEVNPLDAVWIDTIATVGNGGSAVASSTGVTLATLQEAQDANKDATVLGSTAVSGTLEFYYDVYIPGNDSSIDYDAIRESRANISIATVNVISATP